MTQCTWKACDRTAEHLVPSPFSGLMAHVCSPHQNVLESVADIANEHRTKQAWLSALDKVKRE